MGTRWGDGGPRTRIACALLLSAALLGAACGARVKPYLGTAGVQGDQTGQPGVTNPNGAPAGPSDLSAGPNPANSTGTTSPATAGNQSLPGGGSNTLGTIAAQSTSGLGALTPKNFPFDPAAQSALCQGTAGNTASAPGVTATSITVGNVSGLTGVLANNFNQGPEAVNALFSAVNAAGGICGRQLKMLVEDDGQDATKNSADVADLIPKVLAFVGSVSDADNGGVPLMANANVPDDGPAINANRGESPMFLSPSGTTEYLVNGHPNLWDSLPRGLKANNDFPLKIATISYQITISMTAAQQFDTLFRKSGASTCFQDYSVQPTTPGLDQDAIQMKQNGCDGVYSTMDVTGTAKLLEAMQRQKYHPKFFATTFDGYTPAQISVPGQAAAQDLQVTLPFVPFNEHHPVVDRYLSQLSTYEPGKDPSGFGILAWAAAEMFVYALLKAGRNPTRATLVDAMRAIDNWDTGGATTPYTPRTRLPAGPCLLETKVKGNDFNRYWPPSGGFFCTGSLVPVG